MSGSKSPVNNADTTAPAIISTTPVDTATSVVRNKSVTATFSEEMDPTTITEAIFTLKES
ncbi:MAG: Ig-like domain-containing protein [Rectinemataceae bacterium]